ncbi:MAG: DUF2927 domain-containing protein [Bacteroidales bacterium]|nr:DUF2927 domain-containing protein [Bacteroidales bacterium]
MKNKLLLVLLLSIIASSCSKDKEDKSLNEYEIGVIDYFKDIALGFEYGDASNITRRWNTEMRVFIGGEPNAGLLTEFEKIRTEINALATNGFKVTVVNDSSQSNYYIFLGTGTKYAKIFPNESDYVNFNWGLFFVYYNGQNQFYSGHMFVDIMRANPMEQKHLLREEFTQSLGLAQDSPLYMESIFQSEWTATTNYAPIDMDLVRLLYHPKMSIGLNETRVDKVLREILISE